MSGTSASCAPRGWPRRLRTRRHARSPLRALALGRDQPLHDRAIGVVAAKVGGALVDRRGAARVDHAPAACAVARGGDEVKQNNQTDRRTQLKCLLAIFLYCGPR